MLGVWEPVFICILCLVGLIFLPVILIALFFRELFILLLSPSEAASRLKGVALWICEVTLGTLRIIKDYCCLFLGRPTESRIETVEGPWRTKPSPDDVEHNAAHPEQNPSPLGSSTGSEKKYQYQHLTEVNQFRILVISPGSFNEKLHGRLIISDFSDSSRRPYDALSYTWADDEGDAKGLSEFYSDDDKSIIWITKNCEAAIRRLRRSDQERFVWIDALCINQDNQVERNCQVSMMSQIYTEARQVVVYIGEGTTRTDRLFDWLNGLKDSDINATLENDLDNLAATTLIGIERCWSNAQEYLAAIFKSSAETRLDVSREEFIELAEDYFSRRWFKRVWVLQEVSLPHIRNTTVICGSKKAPAIRSLYALSQLYFGASGTKIQVFALLKTKVKVTRSQLLDVLMETRNQEAGDPRDKIFGILSISNYLDKGSFPELKADYEMTPTEVYQHYSELFIQQHGPGFFLSLIKPMPRMTGLSSWAADWTVPWPNYKVVEGRDFPAGSRPTNLRDIQAEFNTENGCRVLTLHRSRITQGYLTRNGHLDDEKGMLIEDLNCLRIGEILVEMYPGLAMLLKQEAEYCTFIQVCPHALSEAGVEKLVGRWNRVVLDGEGLKDLESSVYLDPVETYKIR